MNNMEKQAAKKSGRKKMPGWLIAFIVVAVIFITGAICCNTIGNAQDTTKNTPQVTVQNSK